jgi:cell division protein FtsI/penicillin-binding protein 2
VTARLSGERQFAYIARALTPREQQAVNSLGIPGLYFEQAERRAYPQGRSAAHILGGVDVDGTASRGSSGASTSGCGRSAASPCASRSTCASSLLCAMR